MYRCLLLLIATVLVAPAARSQSSVADATQKVQQMLQADPLINAAARVRSAETSPLDQVWYRSWTGDGWEDQARTLYVYNNGFRTEVWRYASNGFGLVNDTKTVYTYDGSQRRTSAVEYEWDPETENFLPLTRQRFYYTNDAHIATDVYYDEWDDDVKDFFATDRETYTLSTIDGQQFITGGTSYIFSGFWYPVDRFVLEEIGDDAVFTNQEFTGDAWANTERSVYLHHTIPQLYAQLEQLMRNLEELEMTYLAIRLPDAVNQEWTGTDWVNISRQVTNSWYELFTGAILRSETRSETWEDGEWITDGRQVIVFELVDYTSRPDSLWIQFPMDEDEWLTLAEETFDYDTEGRLQHIYSTGMSWFGEDPPRTWTTLFWGVGTSIEDEPVASRFMLEPAYPNPFNPSTTLQFQVAAAGDLSIHVYDMLGRRVATLASGHHPAGEHSVHFDAAGLPSGTYLVRLEASGVLQTRSVTLLK